MTTRQNPEKPSPSDGHRDSASARNGTQHGAGKTHIWDKPENVDRLLKVFYAISVILVLLDFVVHRHVAHPWERFFGFHAFYGFVACWTLVVVAKVMRKYLMRGEDYYDVD